MNENQYKLIKQVRNYIENVNPVLKNFSSFYSYCNHYAFNTYDLWHDIPNDIDFSDKVTLNNTYFKSSKSSSCHRICFGKFLNKLSRSSRAQFIWMPYITTPNSQGCANFTWLTKEELEKHVLYPKTHYGLDYNVRVYSPEEFVYTDDSEDLPFGTYFTVIFDFKKLDYISSAGLRILLTTQQKMEETGRPDVTVCGANPATLEVFKVTGFDNVLNIR